MEDFFMQLNRPLDDELSNLQMLTSQVTAMTDVACDLYMSTAVASNPDLSSAARETEAVVKEAEAQLSAYVSKLHATPEVKMECAESSGEGMPDHIVSLEPDCTVATHQRDEVDVING